MVANRNPGPGRTLALELRECRGTVLGVVSPYTAPDPGPFQYPDQVTLSALKVWVAKCLRFPAKGSRDGSEYFAEVEESQWAAELREEEKLAAHLVITAFYFHSDFHNVLGLRCTVKVDLGRTYPSENSALCCFNPR